MSPGPSLPASPGNPGRRGLLAAACLAASFGAFFDARGVPIPQTSSETSSETARERIPSGEEAGGREDRVVVLRSGHRMDGTIVKRTEEAVFLDIGFTILRLPVAEIREIEESSRAASGTEPGDRKDLEVESESIFFGAKLERGTIEQKAREVAESVVRVLCLGKSGSGFIVNGEEGYVVTNCHVIEGEQDISVVLYVLQDGSSDGPFEGDDAAGADSGGGDSAGTSSRRAARGLRKLKLEKVRIVAMNPFFDLALLKIEDSEGVRLRTAYLGDFERVKVGDPVFAVGSPLGLERTVTEGIVSNRNRALSGQLSIQSTAPIHPGNSGGPLFNDRGEVIGVTSLKIIGTDSLGFAIPVHYVKDFLRNRDSFAFDKDHPNTGIRYLAPPPKRALPDDPSARPPEGERSSLSGAPAGGEPPAAEDPRADEGRRPKPRGGRL